MRFGNGLLALAIFAGSAVMGAADAADLRVNGAATLAKMIMVPNEAKIEADSGVPIALVMNGSGNGLKDLAAGRADIAMIAAPLEVEEALVNGSEPGSLDTGRMKVFPVASTEIFFLVNPKNPVGSLTADQVRGLFSGEIADWGAVGGAPGPVMVMVEKLGNGTRTMVQTSFLKEKAITPKAREVPALAQLAKIVAQAPNAIAYGNPPSIVGEQVRVLPDVRVVQPLALVTLGEPTAEMRRVIDAVIAAAK